MGYPMTWKRLVNRNGLGGGYDDDPDPAAAQTDRRLIAGDMRRLEQDARDERHLRAYAELAGVEPAQVKRILDAFFEDVWRG